MIELFSEKDIVRYRSKVSISDGCHNWIGGFDKDGYGIFYISITKAKQLRLRAHRISWEFANGIINNGINVLHNCDNRKCCNVLHLFLGLQVDNVDDMVVKRRQGMTRFSDAQIIDLRRRWDGGARIIDLAREFSVCIETMSAIVKRKSYLFVSELSE